MTNKKNEIDQILERLTNKLTDRGISWDIKTQLDFSILRSQLNIESTEGQIIKTLKKYSKAKKIDKDDFIKNLKAIQRSDLEEDRKTLWKLYLPLNIELPKRVIRANNQVYRVKSNKALSILWDIEFYKIFDLDNSKFEPVKFPQIKGSVLEIETYGRNLYSAWKTIYTSFALIRGTVDYSLAFSTWTFISGAKSRSRICHPNRIFGISKGKKPEYLEFIVNEGQSHFTKFSINEKKLLNYFFSILKNTPKQNSIEDLLYDGFRLYHHGMDERIIEYSFIRFWQLAERLSFPIKNKTNETNLMSRLNMLCKIHFKDNLETYVKSLLNKRNNFVHHGIEAIDENDLNFMKTLCEHTIYWIAYHRQYLKTRIHLEEFYRKKDTNDFDLNTSREVINFILSFRQ